MGITERDTAPPPAEVPSPPDALVVVADVPTCAPDDLFAYWTRPELLRRWWPPVATVEPRVGGAYHLAWPDRDWHLRGTFTTFAPGAALAFSWRWDHDPAGHPVRRVGIVFAPLGERGTRLTLTHGQYTTSPEDREERRGHLEGWRFFLPRLQQVSARR